MSKGKKYKELLDKIGIDETYTKRYKKIKFDTIKDNIPPLSDYNQMADLLILPKTKDGYRYLLTVVDLWSDELDFEAMKTKEPKEALKALQTIYKRKHLKNPYATLRTDGGSEFKGVFHKWLKDKNILHSVALPDRHKQLSKIENVNRQLSRFINGYLNKVGKEKGKAYYEWNDKTLLETLRTELNKIRKVKDEDPYTYKQAPIRHTKLPKYKVNDLVIRKLEVPKSEFTNRNEDTKQFREGDLRWDYKEPKKVLKVLTYPNNYRYVIEGFPQVSFTEEELLPSNETESKFAVKAILDKGYVKNKLHYKVQFKGETKKQALWLSKKNLIEDGLESVILAFEQDLKNKKKKKK
jgi:hypothetical protein